MKQLVLALFLMTSIHSYGQKAEGKIEGQYLFLKGTTFIGATATGAVALKGSDGTYVGATTGVFSYKPDQNYSANETLIPFALEIGIVNKSKPVFPYGNLRFGTMIKITPAKYNDDAVGKIYVNANLGVSFGSKNGKTAVALFGGITQYNRLTNGVITNAGLAVFF